MVMTPITDGEFVTYDRHYFYEVLPLVEIDLHGSGDECSCKPMVVKGPTIKTRIVHNFIKKEKVVAWTLK